MRRLIGASEGSSIYLLGLCAGSIMSLLLSLIFSRTNASLDGMSVYSWIGYAMMQVAFVAVVIIYCRVRRIDLPYVARLRRPLNFRQFILLPFIAIAIILITLPLANLWSYLLSLMHFDGGGAPMPAYSNVGIYFLSLLLMAVLPAIGEELLMRGALLHGLSTKNVFFGVFMSALFFSLMHSNPLQTVHQFGLGVALAIVVILTGSLFSAMIIHFFNNFISITLTAYLPEVDRAVASLGYYNFLTGAASIIVGAILLLVLLYILYSLGEKHVGQSIEYENFSIYAIGTKRRPVKDFFRFFRSLFSKAGWVTLSYRLSAKSGYEQVADQPMAGVYIALGLTVIYWLYSFIAGLI